MFVVSVTLWLKPEHIEDFKTAILDNARNSRLEPGNLRFDVNQCVDDPARFHLYEVYLDETAFKDHQQTRHYFRWRDAVADWMTQPRQGIKHNSLFPDNDGPW